MNVCTNYVNYISPKDHFQSTESVHLICFHPLVNHRIWFCEVLSTQIKYLHIYDLY